MLDRKSLLAKQAVKIEKVDLGGGEFVFVKEMTGAEKNRWDQSMLKETKDDRGRVSYSSTLDDFMAKLAVCTVCDEEGKLLLRPGDVSELSNNISASRLAKIVEVAQRLNMITEEDKEEITKNSDAVQ